MDWLKKCYICYHHLAELVDCQLYESKVLVGDPQKITLGKKTQRFPGLPHCFSWSVCNNKLTYFRWQLSHTVSCILRLLPSPTTTISSQDVITNSVVSSRKNSDSSSFSRETSLVSSTISIPFPKSIIKQIKHKTYCVHPPFPKNYFMK